MSTAPRTTHSSHGSHTCTTQTAGRLASQGPHTSTRTEHTTGMKRQRVPPGSTHWMRSIVTCSDASRWACYNPAPLPLSRQAHSHVQPDKLQSAKVQRVQPADLLVQALSDEDEAEPGYEPCPPTHHPCVLTRPTRVQNEQETTRQCHSCRRRRWRRW